MLVVGTLGPAGSNHAYVARRYLEFHDQGHARLELFPNFEQAFDSLLCGAIDHVIQVAVHPSVTSTIARLRNRAHLIDTFLSPSQPMAVLTRAGVEKPSSLGLQMATRDYIDTTRWPTLIAEPTTISVADGLLAGKYDSGITLARFATAHPSVLVVDEAIGTVVDPWLVFGNQPVVTQDALIWPDSPAAWLLKGTKCRNQGRNR
ncbi:MAG: hypothetical protein ACR2PI_14565 [Hyphomicrobiaceae bacterium]